MGLDLAVRFQTSTRDPRALRRALGGGVEEFGKVRIPEFLLFFSMFMYTAFQDGASILGHVILVAICLYALTKEPRLELGPYRQLIWLVLPALVYIMAVSSMSEGTGIGYDWKNRLVRIGAVLIFCFVAALGRIDLKSGIFGFLAACIVNIPLFYLGLVSDTYGGALTGVFLDKNVAGLAYAAAVLLAFIFIDRRFYKWLIVAILLLALWLTGSRTSMGAVAGAFIWIIFTPRMNNIFGKAAIAYFIYWGINFLTEEYSQAGVFEDRVGSDALRERIDEASLAKLQTSGFWGLGLGEAVVELQEHTWSFHNSYWSALVEGGWPWLFFVVSMTVIVMLPFWRRPENQTQLATEGLGFLVLITATRLGEVFLTTYWALMFVTCLQFRLKAIDKRTPWEKYADSERERRERAARLWKGEDRAGRDWRVDHATRLRGTQELHRATVRRGSRWSVR